MTKGKNVDPFGFTRLYGDLGLDLDALAEAFDISPMAVRKTADRLNLPKRPLKARPKGRPTDALFRKMWLEGATREEIAEACGVDKETVRNIRHRLELPDREQLPITHDPEIAERVRELMEQKKTRPEIAEILGVSLETLTRIRRRWQLPRFHVNVQVGARGPARPLVDRDLVREYTEDGLDCKQIADRLGCSEGTVSRIRTELGINVLSQVNKYPESVRQRALEMLEDGASYLDVGETLGISYTSLHRWFPNMGWTPEEIYEYRKMRKLEERIDGTRVDRRVHWG